jgi:hypothetical protein
MAGVVPSEADWPQGQPCDFVGVSVDINCRATTDPRKVDFNTLVSHGEMITSRWDPGPAFDLTDASHAGPEYRGAGPRPFRRGPFLAEQ